MRLVRGKGSPDTGACWMSAIAWYAGERDWTDAPECVCETIRPLAIVANDEIDDDAERERRVGPVLFSVMGTATDDEAVRLARVRVAVRFAARCARRVLDLVRPDDRAACVEAIEAADAWADEPTEEHRQRAARAASATCAAWAECAASAACAACAACDASAVSRAAIIDDAFATIAEMAAIGTRRAVPKVRDFSEIPAERG